MITILVLAGMMAVIFAAVMLVTRRLGVGAERRADELRDEVERLGEEWLIPLEGATYRGVSSGGASHAYPHARGNGVAGLTDRRVVFAPIVGDRFSVPLVRVSAARLKDRHRSGTGGRRRHLVFELDDGNEVGFLIADPDTWARRLAEAGVEVDGSCIHRHNDDAADGECHAEGELPAESLAAESQAHEGAEER